MDQIKYILILIVLVSTTAFAQQDPLNSQYMYNPLVFNPSYAGINDITNVTLSSRFQWGAFENAPTTYSLSANTSVVGGKVGLGLMILNDKIGVSESTEGQASFAYKISSGRKVFSFGLQAGFVTYKKTIKDLTLRVSDDPFFQSGIENSTKFNIGAGATYMTEDLYISFSVPKLINSKSNNGIEIVDYERHFYLLAAYLYDFKPGLKFKPSVLIRGVSGAPPAFDVNLSLLINNQIWAGAFTRNFKTFGVMAQFDFMDAYKIGYSYEFLGTDFSNKKLSTHEIMLSADFALFSHQAIYKRFF